MRRAAARAARRLGSRTTMRPDVSFASNSAGGTRVVLPAPVGARKTTDACSRSVAVSFGRIGAIGRGSNNFSSVPYNPLPWQQAPRLLPLPCRRAACTTGRTRGKLMRLDSILNVAQIVPVTDAEGPGRRFALWFQGCPLRCPGCCNPEMLPFAGGTPTTLEVVVALLKQSVE